MLDFATLPKVDAGSLNILIALPAFGSMTFVQHNRSLRGLEKAFQENHIRYQIAETQTESLIPRARNAFANICCFDRNSQGEQYTHLLFLDVDIGFNPDNILQAIGWDKEIAALPYPCKSINWHYIVTAVKRGVEDPIALSRMGSRPIINATESVPAFNVDEPTENFPQLGTGILLIKRQVFEKMAEAKTIPSDWEKKVAKEIAVEAGLPDSQAENIAKLMMRNNPSNQRNYRLMEGEKLYGPRGFAYDFFQIGINPETRYYDSEDYRFCLDARALGFKTWLLPWGVTSHTGSFDFWMDIKAQAQVGIPGPDLASPHGGFVPMTI